MPAVQRPLHDFSQTTSHINVLFPTLRTIHSYDRGNEPEEGHILQELSDLQLKCEAWLNLLVTLSSSTPIYSTLTSPANHHHHQQQQQCTFKFLPLLPFNPLMTLLMCN